MANKIGDRASYEGAGGWNDGRLGQAYDLIADIMIERGDRTHSHPLLKAIEQFDEALKGAKV